MNKARLIQELNLSNKVTDNHIMVSLDDVLELINKKEQANTVKNQLKRVLDSSFNDLDVAGNIIDRMICDGELVLPCRSELDYKKACELGFHDKSIFGQWFMQLLDGYLENQNRTEIDTFKQFMEWMGMVEDEKVVFNELTCITYKDEGDCDERFSTIGYDEFYAGVIYSNTTGEITRSYVDSHVSYNSDNCSLIDKFIKASKERNQG